MGTIGSSTTLDGLLNCNVRDNTLVDIKTLSLAVSLQVKKEFADCLD